MADDPKDKTPEAIKKHKVQKNFDMKGMGGPSIRQAEANKTVAKDQDSFSGNRAAKYAKVEKAKIADKEHVREGTKGRLSPEMNKAANKEKEM